VIFVSSASQPSRIRPVAHPATESMVILERSSGVKLRRGLGFLLGTLLVPGSAQLFAGNKAVGRLAVRIWAVVLSLLLLLGLLVLLNRGAAIGLVANGTFLRLLQPVLMVLGLGWAGLVLDSWRLAQPMRMQRSHRFGFGITALVVAVALGWTAIAAGQAVRAQGDMLSTVLAGGGSNEHNDGRLNVLLLGGDAGADRDGLRPDSITVASVDVDTGRTVLFSLPRNMEAVPLGEDSPLRPLYPGGYDCEDHSCMLNAVYTLAEAHTDLFPGEERPGVVATRQAVEAILGLKINYYAMIDLEGFSGLIDAVGGITLDIGRRVPIGGGTSKVSGYIEPGKGVQLDGYHALWFARSRHGSSDYDRMLRQKCVMSAMLNQLDPVKVLGNFKELAAAGKQIVATDVPSADVSMLIDLATKARSLPVSSVSFAPPLIYPGTPDLEKIRSTVQSTVAHSQDLDKAPDVTPEPTSASTGVAEPSGEGSSSQPATAAAGESGGGQAQPPPSGNGTPQATTDDIAAVCSVG